MTIDELKGKGIKITRVRGDEVLGLCPFHDDKRPSFVANLSKQVYYCFSCGAKGTFRQLGIKSQRTVFRDSYAKLLELLSGNDEDVRMIFGLPSEFIPISDSCNIYWDYIFSRWITREVVDKFSIGYCRVGNYASRIIVPLDVGFVARSIYNDRDGHFIHGRNFRKYLYPIGLPVSKMLFNYNPESSSCLLVEGVFDVLRLASYGLHSTAIFGCQMSSHQVKMICSSSSISTVYLCFDADDAGVEGMAEAYQELSRYFGSDQVKMVLLPHGGDPASCTPYEVDRAVARADARKVIPKYMDLAEVFSGRR